MQNYLKLKTELDLNNHSKKKKQKHTKPKPNQTTQKETIKKTSKQKYKWCQIHQYFISYLIANTATKAVISKFFSLVINSS